MGILHLDNKPNGNPVIVTLRPPGGIGKGYAMIQTESESGGIISQFIFFTK